MGTARALSPLSLSTHTHTHTHTCAPAYAAPAVARPAKKAPARCWVGMGSMSQRRARGGFKTKRE